MIKIAAWCYLTVYITPYNHLDILYFRQASTGLHLPANLGRVIIGRREFKKIMALKTAAAFRYIREE